MTYLLGSYTSTVLQWLGVAAAWLLFAGLAVAIIGGIILVSRTAIYKRSKEVDIHIRPAAVEGFGVLLLLLGLALSAPGADALSQPLTVYAGGGPSLQHCTDSTNIPCYVAGNSGACTPTNPCFQCEVGTSSFAMNLAGSQTVLINFTTAFTNTPTIYGLSLSTTAFNPQNPQQVVFLADANSTTMTVTTTPQAVFPGSGNGLFASAILSAGSTGTSWSKGYLDIGFKSVTGAHTGLIFWVQASSDGGVTWDDFGGTGTFTPQVNLGNGVLGGGFRSGTQVSLNTTLEQGASTEMRVMGQVTTGSATVRLNQIHFVPSQSGSALTWFIESVSTTQMKVFFGGSPEVYTYNWYAMTGPTLTSTPNTC